MTTHTAAGPAGLTPQAPRRIIRAAVLLAVLLVLAVLTAPVVVKNLTTGDSSVTVVVPHPSPGPDPDSAILGRN